MVKLLKQMKPFIPMIVVILIAAFFQSIADLYLPTLMSDIVNTGIAKNDTAYIWHIGRYMILVAGLSAVCSVIGSYFSAKTSVGFGRNLRNKLFNRVENYSLHEIDKIGTASLITRTTNDITQIQNVYVMIFRMMITAPMMCIGGIIMALSKDKTLTLVLAVAIPVLVITILLVGGKVIKIFKIMQKKVDKLNLVLREGLTGIRVIRAFDKTKDESKRFNEANKDLTSVAIKANKIIAALMPVMMFVMNFTTIAIVWFGSIRISNNDMQVGDMMAFIQYAMQIMISVLMVAVMFVMVPRAEASAVRINEVLDLKPEINDTKNPEDTGDKKGYVEFKNVSFSYPGAEEPVIKDISFAANPGETTAIIGGTGSGKSTLINLIPRFYDLSKGSILVDGVDIRNMTQETLRSKIGFVPQKAVLFTGTISENIRYGKKDATDEEVKHAADVAQATEFISDMNDGFDSEISQGGSNVSGGQKQRLSIARALVRKPEIYIFDDSFSALDFKTDAKLRMALKDETKESTSIIIAQRVSTVMSADRIIVLDEGKVVGMGTHKELLKTCDIYREIVLSQLSKEELA